ncbi:hypothetical protein RB653_008311 [Dictyostelium firmibasis]|uniref:Peptidase C14 caspase domain-containing protein n=1 Tax=Dictyostelium firmibasis TaxID=79012 RepID=A0AAN7TSK7_9MYCE
MDINKNEININRQFSRHVPDEWDFFENSPSGENNFLESRSQFRENYKNIKIKKAFIIGNNYGSSMHFDNDAKRMSDTLESKCGFQCSLVTNEPNLKKKFQEYLNLFKFTDTNIDLIFYYSGFSISKKNGIEFELENNLKSKSKKQYLSLNEIVDMIEIREKEIESGCSKLFDLKVSFKKLFILDCCRLNDDSPIDQYIPVFKKYSKEVEEIFKESKREPFEHNQYMYEKISTFTNSLIGRIISPRAPGRNLKTIGQIISEDLFNQYKKSNHGDFSKQYKMWFSGLNLFSLEVNNGYTNSSSSMVGGSTISGEKVIPELFEKYVKEKFNIHFGDKNMNKFILVENEDPLEAKKKQKQQYLKNRILLSPQQLNSSSQSVPVLIQPSKSNTNISGGNVEFSSSPIPNSPSFNWYKGINMTQSAPNIPVSNSPKLYIGSKQYRCESPTPNSSPIQCDSPPQERSVCENGQSSTSPSLSPLLTPIKTTTTTTTTSNSITTTSCALSGKNMFKNLEHLNREGEWDIIHPNQYESNQDLL